MKILIILLVLTGCATHKNNKLVDESHNLTPKTLEEKKAHVHEMLSKHSEFDNGTKAKIEKILISSLDKSKELRERESQLIQQISTYTIVKKASYDEMVKLKSELKKLYNTKYKNFESAINRLKKIVGIKQFNSSLMEDIYMEHVLDR
jgi:hypothetical protein